MEFESKRSFPAGKVHSKGEMMKFMSRVAGLLLAIGLAAMLTGGAAQAAPIGPFSGVFHPIRNVGNNLCLQPDPPVPGAGVVQKVCDANNLAQGWQFQQIATNRYEFVNQLVGQCLSVFIGNQNGAPLGLQQCRHASGQGFNTNAPLPGVVTLESRIGFQNTGRCVDAPGGSSTPGLQMQIFSCNGTLAQRWVVGFD